MADGCEDPTDLDHCSYLEPVLQSLQQELFALPLLLSFLLSVVLLGLGGANDQVELGHGDDPGVTVGSVEGDLEGDLTNESWEKINAQSCDYGDYGVPVSSFPTQTQHRFWLLMNFKQ